jgi:hypothetical protein
MSCLARDFLVLVTWWARLQEDKGPVILALCVDVLDSLASVRCELKIPAKRRLIVHWFRGQLVMLSNVCSRIVTKFEFTIL